MSESKQISANIPEELLLRACKFTGLSKTETLIAGLEALIARGTASNLHDLKGTIHIDLDLDENRERKKL